MSGEENFFAVVWGKKRLCSIVEADDFVLAVKKDERSIPKISLSQ